VFAVEPSADMLEQLATIPAPFSNAKVIDGSAESTKLLNGSVDVIINAQSLVVYSKRLSCNV